MDFKPSLPSLSGISTSILTSIRTYNGIIAVLNITGNSLLILGLKKSGQAYNISFNFIILMSISDLVNGITGLSLFTLLTWEKYHNTYWLVLSTQTIMTTCNFFSFFMVFLIAYDRYLHMRYLERYSVVFTRKKGHLMVLGFFTSALSISIIFILPLPHKILAGCKTFLAFLSLLLLFAIFLLYYSAMQKLKKRENQCRIARNIATQSRSLGKAAKKIIICIVILTFPMAMVTIFETVSEQKILMNTTMFRTLQWFAYITYLCNAFSSSLIFISQNRPIRKMLRRTTMHLFNHTLSSVTTAETQA